MPRGPARDAGLAARHAAKDARRKVLCGYLERRPEGKGPNPRQAGLCTAEAADPSAPVLLCTAHQADVMRDLIPRLYAKIRGDILAEVGRVIEDVPSQV